LFVECCVVLSTMMLLGSHKFKANVGLTLTLHSFSPTTSLISHGTHFHIFLFVYLFLVHPKYLPFSACPSLPLSLTTQINMRSFYFILLNWGWNLDPFFLFFSSSYFQLSVNFVKLLNKIIL